LVVTFSKAHISYVALLQSVRSAISVRDIGIIQAVKRYETFRNVTVDTILGKLKPFAFHFTFYLRVGLAA
jgi:hypothetical protein